MSVGSNEVDKLKKREIEMSRDTTPKALKEILQFKIVYWGPGESGKTTNYFRLREKFNGIVLNKGISIETTDGRTLWQDSIRISFFLNLGEVKFNVIAQIVTCTGQERFLQTREYVLDGADGVMFVGDSDPDKMEQNKRSFRELLSFTKKIKIPYVIQLNKRDIEDAIDIGVFKRQLGLPISELYDDGTRVIYPVIALSGENVKECFEDLIIQVIFNYFKNKLNLI
ncbi:MAG: ADP-ribosylation factor-like protein [Promethearchaeota archaeon]